LEFQGEISPTYSVIPCLRIGVLSANNFLTAFRSYIISLTVFNQSINNEFVECSRYNHLMHSMAGLPWHAGS